MLLAKKALKLHKQHIIKLEWMLVAADDNAKQAQLQHKSHIVELEKCLSAIDEEL